MKNNQKERYEIDNSPKSMEIKKVPEADCAIYDLSARYRTKKDCLEYCITFLRERNCSIYWYTLRDKYLKYNGEEVIVYLIDDTTGYPENFDEELAVKEANGYLFDDPCHVIKKIILLATEWSEMDQFLVFNLGLDCDEFPPLFLDAWNGFKHEWRTKDGRLLTNAERLATIYDLQPNCRYMPARRKDRKPKIRLQTSQKSSLRRNSIVYLMDKKGWQTAYFDFKF